MELPFEIFTATIVPGQVHAFLGTLPQEELHLHSTHSDYVLTLGDLDVPFGPLALWMPRVALVNHDELLKHSDDPEPVARFKSIGPHPMYFRSRGFALEVLAQKPADAECAS